MRVSSFGWQSGHLGVAGSPVVCAAIGCPAMCDLSLGLCQTAGVCQSLHFCGDWVSVLSFGKSFGCYVEAFVGLISGVIRSLGFEGIGAVPMGRLAY